MMAPLERCLKLVDIINYLIDTVKIIPLFGRRPIGPLARRAKGGEPACR